MARRLWKPTRPANTTPITMDMEMPVMSGLQAAHEIRQMEEGFHLTCTPILFLTGNESAVQIDQAYQAGGDGHLCKPFTSHAA
ncbi:MAG: response regulator [Micavibrio sp.]|nr:response regulator [Micavibrio sp.]